MSPPIVHVVFLDRVEEPKPNTKLYLLGFVGIKRPFVDIPTLHPLDPLKLQTDKSLTNVVHALLAVIQDPTIIASAQEFVVLH